MKNIKNESTILNLIKYGPILFVLVLSFLFTYLFINEKKNDLKEEITNLEKVYIEENKNRVKRLVERVHSRIVIERENNTKLIKELLKSEVYQAYSVIESIYNENSKKPNFNKEKTINEIKIALRNIRFFDDLGYFFIYDFSGVNILNPKFPAIEGKNLWNHKDMLGVSLLQEMKSILQLKNETYYDWFWKKSNDDKNEYKKIGFFKKFEPLNIFVGTGQYFDVVEEEVKKRITNSINKVKFDSYEHVFIYTLNGVCLVNPKKELVGKNRYDVKNKKGEYSLRQSLEFVKDKKEGFRHYGATVQLNNSLNSNSKISYLKLYEEWNWMIGSGFYLEGLHKKVLKKEEKLSKSNDKAINQAIYISIFITSIFILISFYLSKQLENRFNEYKNRIEKELKNSYEKEKLLVQQSKMATMGEMLGSIAHQWKQPLSLLSLSNGLIKISRETKGIFSEKEVDESIANIDTAIHNLNQTVDDFRNFFNPNKERTLFKVSDAFEETFKLTSSQFKNNNIELIKDISEIELYGSQNELQQVLINLLKNAKEELIKKDPTKKRFIFISTKKEDKLLNIEIKDNAGGIPKDIINKVFEAYFTTKEKDGGSGIGLYMSKQIIESHMKGSISVQNESFVYDENTYEGAKFIISIPIDLRTPKR